MEPDHCANHVQQRPVIASESLATGCQGAFSIVYGAGLVPNPRFLRRNQGRTITCGSTRR